MALIRTAASTSSTPTFTTIDKSNDSPITGLTVGKQYVLAFNAGSVAATVTGATIDYQEYSTNASGSYYVHLMVITATATSVTLAASGLGNPHVIAEIG